MFFFSFLANCFPFRWLSLLGYASLLDSLENILKEHIKYNIPKLENNDESENESNILTIIAVSLILCSIPSIILLKISNLFKLIHYL